MDYQALIGGLLIGAAVAGPLGLWLGCSRRKRQVADIAAERDGAVAWLVQVELERDDALEDLDRSQSAVRELLAERVSLLQGFQANASAISACRGLVVYGPPTQQMH